MHLTNTLLWLIVGLCVLCRVPGQAQNVRLEKTASFFPKSESLKKNNIAWQYLSVPENWDNPKSKAIKIGVAVLKNRANKKEADAIVFIQGGPGASGIRSIEFWLDSPLVEKHDIVLVDVRGTGFSEPRLCPDLGKEFLEILAKNQSVAEDEKEKTAAALSCRQDLINQGVDIGSYNSLSVAKDLHALKTALGYSNWHLYGVSYGTYMAQVYTSLYPGDIKTLTLDSPVSDVTTYYTRNTTNYLNSLKRVFNACQGDPDCQSRYPDLESLYYETIADLKKRPITVSVDKSLVESQKFTFSHEDFKVAIQQALYNKQLIEMIPLLIYQFHDRNQDALGNLVSAFVGLLRMDYGLYYCVSCNEVLPNNKMAEFRKDAAQYKKLEGGLSFYKSDFLVCEQWNQHRQDSTVYFDLSKLTGLATPVLVYSGEYDPLMPVSNGKEVAGKFKNGQLITAFTYGHAPSFTKIGQKLSHTFIDNASHRIASNEFEKDRTLDFVKGVTINRGVSRLGNSLDQFNLIFLAPLILALGIVLAFVFVYIINLIRRKYRTQYDKLIRVCVTLTSIAGITGLVSLISAVGTAASDNYFVLAFGLPDNFDQVFILLKVFTLMILLTSVCLLVGIKKIKYRSIIVSVLFSNMLIASYLFYWGVI